MIRLNQKGITHILAVFILLAGIVTGLYLIQHPQIFNPKAYLENINPLLYQQRIDSMRTTFKLSDNLSNEQIQMVAKDDLFKSDITIDGDIAQGDAQVRVTGDCLEYEQTNYYLSEYGAFPPLCLTDEQKEKAIEFVQSGAESAADFVVPYSQAKQALEFGEDIADVRDLLRKTGLADRIQVSPVSGPDSGFDGYAVTLVRIKELEQDVQNNPDGSANLTYEQEEARREYVASLRNLWEEQHNLLFQLASVVAVSVIDRPLKVVGEFAKPVTGPLVSKFNEAIDPAKNTVFDFLKNSWDKLISREVAEAVLKWEKGARGYRSYWQTTRLTRTTVYSQTDIGAIQAMFLGEKPAAFQIKLATETRSELEKRRFRFIGGYVYKPELVEQVLRDYPDEFQRYGFSSSEGVMNALANSEPKELNLIRGLVLGFPLSAARDFEYASSLKINDMAKRLFELLEDDSVNQAFLARNFFDKRSQNTALVPFFEEQLIRFQQQLNITDVEIPQLINEVEYLIKGKSVNIHGVYWIEYEESVESIIKQERLRQAFEESGILNNY